MFLLYNRDLLFNKEFVRKFVTAGRNGFSLIYFQTNTPAGSKSTLPKMMEELEGKSIC